MCKSRCNPSIIVIGVVAKIYVNRTPIPIVTGVMRMSPVTGSWLSRNIWLGTALRLVDITAAKEHELSGRRASQTKIVLNKLSHVGCSGRVIIIAPSAQSV